MKIVIPVLLILFSSRQISAQDCTPAQYQKMLKEADQAVKRGEYDLAINKLQSAKVCQPGKAAEVDGKIVAVFEKVNGERQQAVTSYFSHIGARNSLVAPGLLPSAEEIQEHLKWLE